MHERQSISIERWRGRPYAKMNGIGNAILVLDARGCDLVVSAEEARAIAAMPGLHFDQLMVIHAADGSDADARVRILNTDGSPSGACGNGTRCVAWYLLRDSARESIVLMTQAGRLTCRKLGPAWFSVDMGEPSFRWNEIPLRDASLDPQALDVGGATPAFALGIGNPHAVFFVADAEAVDLEAAGPPVETSPLFPERANVSFAQIVDPATIKLRVWERGAGATLGCGTGACATLVAAAATGRTGRTAAVDLPGGRLEITWRDDNHIIMSGPVELEFEGLLGEGQTDRAA